MATGAIQPAVTEANRNFPFLNRQRAAEGHMKNNRSYSSFEGRSRRRTRLPIIPVILVILLIALIAFLWSRGGEQPQQRVEKVISAEKLGK
jgi:hypothetical protein